MSDFAKNGITLVASGHPYYGRYAYNLAVSIKAVEKFPVAILHAGSALCHLSEEQLGIFDEIIELPDDTPANVSCKLFAGRFSPWEKTLLLDVDMLWLAGKKPSDLFEEMEGVEFTAITEGNEKEPAKDYFFWADTGEIRAKYKIQSIIHQWRTEVVYFTQKGREIIDRALQIVQSPGLTTIKQFGYAVPDELGVNIATAEAGIDPHRFKWQPSYWHLMHNNFFPSPAEMNANYYLVSFGSNAVSGTAKKVYDQIMKASCYKLQRQHVFSMESKRSFLKERDKI